MISFILPIHEWLRLIILQKLNFWAVRIQIRFTSRFFTPERNRFSADEPDRLEKNYIGVVYNEIKKWLQYRAKTGPVGVTFSAGIDSGAVFLLTYHALKGAWRESIEAQGVHTFN